MGDATIGKPNSHYFWHAVSVSLPDSGPWTAPAGGPGQRILAGSIAGSISMGPLAFMDRSRPFTGLAMVELVADQLPTIPSRTAPAGLSARMITGALTAVHPLV
jgi:hypothetical protein